MYKLNITGDKVFPQSEEMSVGYNEAGINSVYNVPDYDLPSFIPDLDSIELVKRANITDFVSCMPLSRGLLVNEKAKKLLSELRLGKHSFYKARLSQAGNYINEPFYWLIQEIEIAPYIDFKESIFYISFNPLKQEEKITFLNYEEYLTKRNEVIKEIKMIFPYKLVISSQLEEDYDIFHFQDIIEGEIFISNNAYKTLIKKKLTGFNLIDMNRGSKEKKGIYSIEYK